LRQIPINLLNNAIKFTERGEVLVTLATEEQLTDTVKLKFAVRDRGTGMTLEQSARGWGLRQSDCCEMIPGCGGSHHRNDGPCFGRRASALPGCWYE